ncbi:craniofacial development protein 1 [Phymastichus coffea]|uniref:craniofacial development protein 1 n=1 Tax=Phymastichus coffea TaxID=108790 RepID=UPI00273AF8F9|nr:craniofacial development protein 1 [Phymastichus coffea]XP_058810184.1 craniofacial development protein 1 [Phymastichus coffea]XP_058810187.1 craniofacial development protein 1 [Phymastichus coffea]XP_058810193.1 craniofacial development protein 1 [Phymastichus coffea]XP_058810198.1 craniofacial development protein 1 [Phymastichus coffea]XP_058810202.1 craniofacial development protein 1 [Phymastichus coffea]
MEQKNFDGSDSDDPDFKISSENLTNEFSNSESESTVSDSNELPTSSVKHNMKMKRIKNKRQSSSKKTGVCDLDIKKNENRGTIELTHEKDKERTDLLWNSFLKCTGKESKNCEHDSYKSTESLQMSKEIMAKQDSYLENDHDSNITKSNKCKQIKNNVFNNDIKAQIFTQQPNALKRRGLLNILSKISKKSKVSTLEKSKQDWNEFKEEHNLNEEITNFNRGKNGYLERQDFLQRTDSRQFEIEKILRTSGKQKSK